MSCYLAFNQMSAILTTIFMVLAVLGTPASAQSVDIPQPPVRSAVDENSVDLTSGMMATNDVQLSIGDSSNGLVFRRSKTGVDNWRHNYLIRLTASAGGAVIGIGDSSVTFNWTGSDWVSEQGNGSTLTESSGIWTYTDRDGTVITLEPPGADYYGGVNAVGTEIVSPSGERTTLHYAKDPYLVCVEPYYVGETRYCTDGFDAYVSRLQSVTNNSGYQLFFEYHDARAISL